MNHPLDVILAVVVAVFASTGFWQFILNVYNKKSQKKSSETRLLLGLAHNVIFDKCEKYLARGYITTMEYDDLLYVYEPYNESGGNGTGTQLFEQVKKLPIKEGVQNE